MKRAPKSLWILLAFFCFAGILKATLPQVLIGTWTSATSLAQARSNASAVMLSDGRILITGGDGASGPLQSAEFFATDGTTSSAAAMNVARSRHFAVVLSDGRVLAGGGTAAGGGTTNSAEIYDPNADSWTQTSPMSEARANATAALLKDGRVLIAGGDNSGTPSNTIEIYDPSTGNFAFAGTLASPRTKHAMAVLGDGRVLIVGGFDGTNPLASSDIFDPSSGNISAGPSLATARFAHSATKLLDGTVLIAGGVTAGSNGTVELASAEIFDPSTGAFSTVSANLATARQGHLAFLLPNNNNVLIVGGTSNGAPVATSELFSPWQGTFAATGANVTTRDGAAGSAMQQDGLLLAAGGSDASGNALASTELYAFPVVRTDASDYAPGSIVTITGSGWQPGETVNLTLVESPLIDTHPAMTAVADGNGNIVNNQFSPDVHDVDVRFYLTAVGSQSGLQAQNTFTDAQITTVVVAAQSPSPVIAGGSATFNPVTVNFGSNNTTCNVTFSTSGLPAGASPSFLPTSVAGANNNTPKTTVLTVGTTSGVAAGSYSFTVTAVAGTGCSGGNATSAPATLLVQNTTSLSTSPITGVFGQSVNLSATLTSGSPAVGVSGQTINFTLNGNAAGSGGPTNASGTATHSASLGAIPPGTYATGVGASFTTNGPILGSTASAQLIVNQASTTTTITAPSLNPATSVAASYTVSWTVAPVAPGSGTPTGTVTVSDGTDSCLAAVGAGSCSLTSNTAGSPKTLTATYSGDTNFIGSFGTQNHTVSKIAATTAVSSSQNPSVFGQSVTFTANVTGAGATPSGTIQFVVDGTNFGSPVTLVAGSASSGATTTLTVAGSPHAVTAQYSGDGNYNAGSGSLTGGQTVNKASTTALITADAPDPSVVGQTVSVHYSVSVTAPGSGTPTGSVQVTDGVSSCTGTVAAGLCNLALATAGARSLTATYQGDPNYNASPASVVEPHQVNAADTTTAVTLTTGTNPSVFGQSLTFTASVSAVAPGGGTPAGNVNFYDGGTCALPGTAIATSVALNSGGQAAASSTTLSVSGSPHSVVACYVGNSNYNASTGSLSQTVNKADTTAAITSDTPDPSTTTQQITVKYTVSVTAPGGGTVLGTENVTVTDGTDSCTGTVAAGQCNVTLTTAGTRTLKATYQGGTNYNASPASPGLTHTVLTPATLDVQSPVTANQQGAPTDLVVKTGDLITVVVAIKDNGGSDVQSVTPPTLVVNHTGTAAATCGAGTGASQVMSGQTHTYTYTCSSVSGDGTLTFTANGSSASGTDATSSAAITGAGTATSNSITVDDTLPSVSITPPTGNVSVPFTFSWSVTDPTAGGVNSGVNTSSCTLKIDATAPVAVPCSSSNSSLVSGTHTVVVAGADIAGNTNSDTRTYTLDNTPPLVTVTFTPIVHGQNGWYNAQDTVPVTGTVTANDSTTGGSNVTAIMCTGATVGSITGLGTVSASAAVSVSAEGVNNVSCTSTDSAGNTGAGGASSNTATIRIDTQAPTSVVGAANRTADNNGWYNHAVTITFSGTDLTSGIANCSSTPYSSPDSATASALGHCTDTAGNSSADTAFNFKYDSTPPTAVGLSVTAGTPGTHGWYTSDVTVQTSGTETVSGPPTCTADQFQTTETVGQVFTGSCTNDAGLTANATPLTVKLDKTGPSATLAVTAGTLGMHGWYTSDVTVSASGNDSISNPVVCTPDQLVSAETTGTAVNGSCTNDAGLSTNATALNVKLDKTAPLVTLAVSSGTAGANSWYTSDVTVHTSGTENISSPISCDADQFQTSETIGTNFNGSCTNDAGLTGHATPLTVKLDKTGPTAALSVTAGTLGDNSWYISNVTVHAAGADSISNPVACTADQFLTTDTTGQGFSGSCTNDAGLTTNATDLSVKRDATPPTVTITPSRGADHNSWYNHALSFTNPGTDSTSGIHSCSTPAAYSGPDSTTASVSATCKDNAGNISIGSFDFMYDATAPTGVTGAPNRAPDHNGWYNQMVDVVFAGTDATAGIESCSTVNYSGPDIANTSVNGTCTDNAGNTSAPVASSSFKFDSTPPSANLAVSAGTLGMHGWYTSDVTVSTTGSDTVSNPTSCTAPQFQTTETTGASFNGSCTNDAGLSANATPLTVKLDKTAPTGVTLTASGTLGLNNWFTSDVTIHTTGTETISNPISCTADQSQTTDTTGQLFSGSCTNDAGLSANATDITIKRDATPPVLILAFTPNSPDGNNGWWKTPGGVPFVWTCSDATSGVDGTYNGGCPSPLSGTVTTNGTTHFNGQVRDQAGNLSVMVNRDLMLDNVAPVVTWTPLATPVGDSCSLLGNSGWCRGTQTAAFSATDSTSGLANPAQASFTQATGTNGTAISIPSGAVMDKAGNVSLGVNAGPYKIDSVAPTITINNPANGANYLLNASVASNYSCSDATSGVATCTGPVANGANISTNPVGAHSFTVNTTDAAGNPAIPVTNNYSIKYASVGMCAGDVGHTIRQPINADGSSVFKLGSTVPTKFAVCDANNVSIGTAGVVTGYGLVAAANSPTIAVDEDVYSTTPDTAFRWDPTAQQWIFNQSTKNNGMLNHTGTIYVFQINLNDGSAINFQYGLK